MPKLYEVLIALVLCGVLRSSKLVGRVVEPDRERRQVRERTRRRLDHAQGHSHPGHGHRAHSHRGHGHQGHGHGTATTGITATAADQIKYSLEIKDVLHPLQT
eukprot:8028303-Pyramimonas_sp.AAC.1